MPKSAGDGGIKGGDAASRRDTLQDRLRPDLIRQDQTRQAAHKPQLETGDAQKPGENTGNQQRRKDLTEGPLPGQPEFQSSGDQLAMLRGGRPTPEQRREGQLQKLKDSGFFQRPDIQSILQDKSNPQRAEKLKEAISVEIVIDQLGLQNAPGLEVRTGVDISRQIPGVSTLKEWRSNNPGNHTQVAHEYNGGVWQNVSDADILVLDRASGSVEKVIQIKTGGTDRGTTAQNQVDAIRTAMREFETGKDVAGKDVTIGVHHRSGGQIEDLTPHVAKTDASGFDGQTWGPLEKDGFDHKLPLTASDFRRLTAEAIQQYGSNA